MRRTICKLLIKLMDHFSCLPSTLFVSGVRVQSRDAVNAGGYADIFKGIYQSKQVALKRFRFYAVNSERVAINKVSDQYQLLLRQSWCPCSDYTEKLYFGNR